MTFAGSQHQNETNSLVVSTCGLVKVLDSFVNDKPTVNALTLNLNVSCHRVWSVTCAVTGLGGVVIDRQTGLLGY